MNGAIKINQVTRKATPQCLKALI